MITWDRKFIRKCYIYNVNVLGSSTLLFKTITFDLLRDKMTFQKFRIFNDL
jgi:hypothetical protein